MKRIIGSATILVSLFGSLGLSAHSAEHKAQGKPLNTLGTLTIGKYVTGRCASQDTGTDFGPVVGENHQVLIAECSRNAVNPIITNENTQNCLPDDPYLSCEMGTDFAANVPGAQTIPGGAEMNGRSVIIPSRFSRRACIWRTAGTPITRFYLEVDGHDPCTYSTGTNKCPYAASQKFTKYADTSTSRDYYCWTVWNEADHKRSFRIGAI